MCAAQNDSSEIDLAPGPRLRTGWILVVGLSLGLGLGLLALFGPRPGMLGGLLAGFGYSENPGPVVSAPAPEFRLENLDGQVVGLKDFQGQPVLINFWATWCAPCRLEMPAIQARYEDFAPALQVLAVNFEESPAAVSAFMDELGLTFPALLDHDGEVNRMIYRVRGYPTSVFVDSEGTVQAVHIGFMTPDQLDGYLAVVGLE